MARKMRRQRNGPAQLIAAQARSTELFWQTKTSTAGSIAQKLAVFNPQNFSRPRIASSPMEPTRRESVQRSRKPKGIGGACDAGLQAPARDARLTDRLCAAAVRRSQLSARPLTWARSNRLPIGSCLRAGETSETQNTHSVCLRRSAPRLPDKLPKHPALSAGGQAGRREQGTKGRR